MDCTFISGDRLPKNWKPGMPLPERKSEKCIFWNGQKYPSTEKWRLYEGRKVICDDFYSIVRLIRLKLNEKDSVKINAELKILENNKLRTANASEIDFINEYSRFFSYQSVTFANKIKRKIANNPNKNKRSKRRKHI